ncbi:MAG: GH3 auxin-responsive promoter family protein [Planctomycetota bacterium]
MHTTTDPVHRHASSASGGGFRWTAAVGAGMAAMVARRRVLLGDLVHWKVHTARLQAKQLRAILRTAAPTEFGRSHSYAGLIGLPDAELIAGFRKSVPLGDYERVRPLINRMRDGGEPNVLWPGLVRDFAQTSGTTSGDKYIPVTAAMMKSNFRASLDIFAHAQNFGVSLTRMLSGRLLFLGGSTELASNQHGVRTGDLSGIVAPLIRWPLSEVYSPGQKIALMSHWPGKIEAMARLTARQDIRMISGMPSWGLKLMERVLQIAREQGRKADCIRDVWPNLTLFVHGGVKYAPFDPAVRRMWSGGDVDFPYRYEVYPASEGFIALQDTRGDPGLRLLADVGIFYEFVPLEEIGDPAARGYLCHEVERGQRYVVVMTTCAGLARYIIGDVVEFDTIPAGLDGRGGEGPCRLRIVGRHKHFINAFGENLIVEHIENAVTAAAAAAGVTIGEFSAAPVYPGPGQKPGLELAVECANGLESRGVLERFQAAFDRSLKEQNVDYTTKRTDDLGMVPPTITVVPMGSFHRWMESRGKVGGQVKCPRCANHRDIVNAVVSLAGTR